MAPLPGGLAVADEFKTQFIDPNKRLATRVNQKKQTNDQPDVPDWLKMSQPQFAIPEQGATTDFKKSLGSVGGLGESANAAVADAIGFKQEAARRRLLAQSQAMGERNADLMGQINGMDWSTGNLGNVSGSRQAVIEAGKRLLGQHYVYGGGHGGKAGPSYSSMAHGSQTYGIDCSGLVRYAFAKAGISKWGNQNNAAGQSNYGRLAPINKLLPGDLVIRGGRGTAGHIAIYLGKGKILEAQKTGTRVHIRSIGNGAGFQGISLNY